MASRALVSGNRIHHHVPIQPYVCPTPLASPLARDTSFLPAVVHRPPPLRLDEPYVGPDSTGHVRTPDPMRMGRSAV